MPFLCFYGPCHKVNVPNLVVLSQLYTCIWPGGGLFIGCVNNVPGSL